MAVKPRRILNRIVAEMRNEVRTALEARLGRQVTADMVDDATWGVLSRLQGERGAFALTLGQWLSRIREADLEGHPTLAPLVHAVQSQIDNRKSHIPEPAHAG